MLFAGRVVPGALNAFPSAPPSRNLIAAIELLYALGALDDRGELSQPLGEQMSELPIHPTLAKMLLSSGEMGCSQEIVTIIAMLQVEASSLSERC